jgi:hypothetical protein
MTYNRYRYFTNTDEFFKFFSIGSVFRAEESWVTFESVKEHNVKIGDLILVIDHTKIRVAHSSMSNRVKILHIDANVKEHLWIDSHLAVEHEKWLTKISGDDD